MSQVSRKVLATEQDLTGSYVNLGTSPNIDVSNEKTVGIIINADVNLSEDVDLKAVGVDSDYGDYEIDGFNEISLWTTGAADFVQYYEYDVGAIETLKFQIKAGTVGGTPGDISAVILKTQK